MGCHMFKPVQKFFGVCTICGKYLQTCFGRVLGTFKLVKSSRLAGQGFFDLGEVFFKFDNVACEGIDIVGK